MGPGDQELLTELRRALLHLHKTLLEWERSAYERVHGRVPSHALLHATLTEPQFAWLRPVSELIVRIDAMLEHEQLAEPENHPTHADVLAVLSQARTLVAPDESGDRYAQRYHAALQEHPDAILAHRSVTTVLKDAPSERTH